MKLEDMMNNIKSIMLDTGFLINLYTDKFGFQNNCEEYYHYFLDNKIELFVSTIAIAEYCVVAPLSDIQLNKFRILPFNIQHAAIAGAFFSRCKEKQELHLDGIERNVIKNDTNILSQVAYQKLDGLITKDKKIEKVINRLKSVPDFNFQLKYIDLEYPLSNYISLQIPIEYPDETSTENI